MRLTSLGMVAAIGLAATPAYGWDCTGTVLIQGGVWNGMAIAAVLFPSAAACEAAANEFETAGRKSISIVRPGLTAAQVKAAFWHECKNACVK